MAKTTLLHPGWRHLRVWIVFLTGVVLSCSAFWYTRSLMRQEVQVEFQAAAQERVRSIHQNFREAFQDVEVLRSFYEASSDVTRQDFDDFTAPILLRHPFIQALEWLPAVDDGNRARLEAEARRVHPGFQFFHQDAEGRLVPLPWGQAFFAVLFARPYANNEVTLGYGASYVPSRQWALAEALRTGEMIATGRVRLIQEPGEPCGMVVMAPVRLKGRRIQGVIQGVYRMGDLVKASLDTLKPRGLSLQLLDGSASGADSLLHSEPSRLPVRGPAHPTGLSLTQTFELAGRSWKVVVEPVGGYFDTRTAWQAWALLVTGLAFSGLLAAYISGLLDRQEVIAEEVLVRTAELSRETESHRKDARALKESEARFHQLVSIMDAGMWVLDTEARTTFVNPRMAELLGYAPDELLGRAFFEFMGPAEVPLAQQRLQDRLQGHSAQYDFRFRKKDGSELWALVVATPIKDEDGRTISILGMFTDITQRRREEQAQAEGQKLESLGVLAGGIAHDFNNLLTAILGNVNLAQMTLPNASPALPYLESMERTVERATNLTRQMLAYSGKGRFLVEPLNLNHAVQEISHLLAVSISKKVLLRYELEPELPPLMADATQIQQVVMNLVTNASEAIGDKEGAVCIRTDLQSYSEADLHRDFPAQSILPGNFVTLEVSDTGKGMSPEVQSRIFEPFFTTKFTGRGLGLAAMQGIVRGHHGGIRVYSEVGQGTTFKLIFPASLDLPVETAPVAQEAPLLGSGSILVVDDEPTILEVASALLRSMGFEVLTAPDGEAALAVFQEHRAAIRVVLLDLTMPRLNGVETFRELRKLQPDCRVVLTSGYNEQEAVHDFIGKGLAGFVQKPFQREHLLAAMRKALED